MRTGTESYSKQLARQIDRALKAAETQIHKKGFALYPFLFGYLAGDCTDEQNRQIDARLNRLQSSSDGSAKR